MMTVNEKYQTKVKDFPFIMLCKAELVCNKCNMLQQKCFCQACLHLHINNPHAVCQSNLFLNFAVDD